ncbi:transcription factor bHLH126 isoform X2 [Spinacia oleracea]|uniref:Transcription factor bHLH126 isoform X2 n=1 Tax=Spinacia oleracea TaxID=3562 RepID=A0ABM3QWE9_SPIOL|nr:transcription factor bHLH126-like isoform X2 [Spinacia oleracea]
MLSVIFLFQGESSVCDNIEEATNYIKDLEKNVKELQHKREKLEKFLSNQMPNDVGPSSTVISSINPSSNENYVKIKASSNELEIEINVTAKEGEVFPLSNVFKVLQLEQGLNVVDCAYSKVNQRMVYVIHCQVDDRKLVDSSSLQKRLINEISSYAS